MPQTTGNLAKSQSVVVIRRSVSVEPNHYGFPGFCVCANGDLLVAYRVGGGHYGTDTANTTTNIEGQRSTDGGRTWSAPFTVAQATTGEDFRDVCLTTLSDDRVVVSFISRENDGANFKTYLSYSSNNGTTWGTKQEVTATQLSAGWSVSCGPVLELANGDLLHVVYGYTGTIGVGLTRRAVCIKSTDGGATWADLSVVVSAADGWLEPNLTLLDNGDIFCGVRTTAEKGWWVKSTDSGATWSATLQGGWSVSAARPATAQIDNGALVWMSRHDGSAFYRTSWDRGVTWAAEASVDYDYRMAYSQQQRVSANVMGAVWSMEVGGSGRADMKFTYLYDNTLADPFADLAAGEVDGSPQPDAPAQYKSNAVVTFTP
jgi:hypothetical protein